MKLTARHRNFASSHVWSVGNGAPLIVVHGGPGLDHSYLVEWLRPFASRRELVFYDQRGCGRDRTHTSAISIDSLVEQLSILIRTLARRTDVGILSHSWGAFLVYETLRRDEGRQIRQAVLASPVGLTRARFDASGERLVSRIPQSVLTEIETLEKAGDGVAVMRAALPYYLASPELTTRIEFGSYAPRVYTRVIESLDGYDARDIAAKLPNSTLLIYGENDIEVPSATKELQKRAQIEIIKEAGHFPFAEQPQTFQALVDRFLT